MPVVHPGDESVIAQIPLGDVSDVDDAVAAAQAASRPWARTPIAERAAALGALADLVLAHGDEFAWLDTLDNGSPIAVMRHDYLMAAGQLRYFAGLALQLRGQTLPAPAPDALDFTLRDPFGVVGRLIPFNHPLMFAASRIAAPLLAGNTVALKPYQDRHARAGREEPADRVPRRGPARRRRRRAARYELPLAGPVVRVHLAPVRPPQYLPAVHRRPGRPDGVADHRRSAARDHRRRPPGVPGPLRPGPRLRRAGPRRSRARARDRRHRHRTARVLRPAHPVPRGRRSARPAVHRGDLRPGPGRRPVRRLRPRHHPGQQPERRPDRERLDDQEGLEEVESYTQHKNVYLRF
jgi:hypothetical protein